MKRAPSSALIVITSLVIILLTLLWYCNHDRTSDTLRVELSHTQRLLRHSMELSLPSLSLVDQVKQRDVLLRDVQHWMQRFNLQKEAPFPASFELRGLDAGLAGDRKRKRLHFTSYHFDAGHGIGNWIDHLNNQEDLLLLVFTPSERAFQVASEAASSIPSSSKRAEVVVVAAASLIERFPLCMRDPGSGIKVAAALLLLGRGFSIDYSDADVVWFQRLPALRADCDMAFQIYPASQASIKLGHFSLNFGLWQARPTERVILILRTLMRRMVRSVELHSDRLQFDTCNDQNNLASMGRKWICGWIYDEVRYEHSGASKGACVWILLFSQHQFSMATPWLMHEAKEDASPSPIALHWTGYWGGHTLAKVNAMWMHGQRTDAPVPPPSSTCQRLRVTHVESVAHFVCSLALALSSGRTLELPHLPCSQHPLGGSASRQCGVHYFFRMDGWLELGRALRAQRGYSGHVDKLRCNCTALKVRPSSCDAFVPPLPERGGQKLFLRTSWKRALHHSPEEAIELSLEGVSLSKVLSSMNGATANSIVAALQVYALHPVDQFNWNRRSMSLEGMLQL